ncbi:MBL fold metallo-hydrolase [Lederbergia lenta]|uniref:N-acyl-phosphatidylethanolamine-hydrolyzing phospholipase D N-acyl phosphatidylethanolamine phospholipase D n=1 Tax=Lederbergia lenta TaxID=1467 RepID=A0A2X4Z0I5_LEDLE|nr:MBL fold metallo-hydrolase [Lederbergia lenta]MCM3110976.1 MBL fold metallo-hydrolase [Lederbergia lenta]MEC2325628.1 MBL fold metallo-hydrolase [Lederbergia lenta]SQI54124.1 N-acyl-phosphatidylethanolamine-hydrolyzing phospholipase D N-acyl phosphatidylethanolamine phospholipase D [Lederbergia lenta]
MKKKRYENIDKNASLSTFKDLLQWRRERKAKQKDLSFQVPTADEIEVEFLQSNRTISTITWIGHSTFLIQLNGKNILTDPIWANRLGLDKRLSPPGLKIRDLPPIDFVVISHSHYDHLHYSSLKSLNGEPTFFVPIGLGNWFKRKGFRKTVEFSWWEEHEVAGLQFTFTPAQHWTKRTLTDTNRSHWGGWVIQDCSKQTIYFAGDSGYFKGFQEIGKKYDINYCLMPIGAYEPEWFMAAQHVSPEEAIKAFVDTQAQTMIPMHYGAYRLADDTPKEALDRLLAEWKKQKLTDERLEVLKIGETLRTD